jgi:hypothetical protein
VIFLRRFKVIPNAGASSALKVADFSFERSPVESAQIHIRLRVLKAESASYLCAALVLLCNSFGVASISSALAAPGIYIPAHSRSEHRKVD